MSDNIRKRFSTDEKINILSKSSNRCAHCGKKLTVDNMTVDHMYPINKGGDNSEYNVIAMCEQCNKNKSNFIYDMKSYFVYIKKEYFDKYYNNLMHNIFGNYSDTSIFGGVNKIIYFATSEMIKKFKGKKVKDFNKVLRALGKPVEIRLLYPGDLTEEILNKIGADYLVDDYGEYTKTEFNIYVLRDMFRYCSFYGAYTNDKLIALRIYCNLDKLKITEGEELKTELYKRDLNKVYVMVLNWYDTKYQEISKDFEIIETEFMAYTNNIILGTQYIFKKVMSEKMKGNLTATYEILPNDFLKGEYENKIINFLILDDTEYTNRLRSRENFQKYYKLHSYAEDNNNGKD